MYRSSGATSWLSAHRLPGVPEPSKNGSSVDHSRKRQLSREDRPEDGRHGRLGHWSNEQTKKRRMIFQLRCVPTTSCLEIRNIIKVWCYWGSPSAQGVKKMKGSSRNLQVSAAILSVLLFALLVSVSPIQSRKIAKDDLQSGGNEEVVGATLARAQGGSPPSPHANSNRPDLPALQTSKHH
ncbi:hypothetical protein ACLOJK_032869 [Asimina triloba]